MNRILLAQLYALRAQLDAVIVSLEGAEVECAHPTEHRRDTTKMGSATHTFLCLACNREVEGVA